MPNIYVYFKGTVPRARLFIFNINSLSKNDKQGFLDFLTTYSGRVKGAYR